MASSTIASLAQIDAIEENEIAYLAGLIDADGTVTINAHTRRSGRRSYPSPMVLVVNGNLELIRWIKQIVGFGCAYETKNRPTRPDQNESNWNPVHRYQLTGRPAQLLLRRCRKYLKVKHRQADLIIPLAAKGVDFVREASDAQHSIAKTIVEQVRALNRRGLHPLQH